MASNHELPHNSHDFHQPVFNPFLIYYVRDQIAEGEWEMPAPVKNCQQTPLMLTDVEPRTRGILGMSGTAVRGLPLGALCSGFAKSTCASSLEA